MRPDEGLRRLEALGFAPERAGALWEHFDDAEQRGKLGHGHSRIPWLETLEGFDPVAEPLLAQDDAGFQRWHGNGALGYLVLGDVVAHQLERPPADARFVVCERTFPTGMLVIAGLAPAEDLVPFGGEQWHKAFALAVGLQALVDSLLLEPGFGAVLLVARPDADPVPMLRERANGLRLPGDR